MSRIPFAVLPIGGHQHLRTNVGQLFAGANLAEIGIGHGAVSRKRHRALRKAWKSTQLRKLRHPKLGDRKWSRGNCAYVDLTRAPRARWSPEAWAAAARQRR